MKNSKKDQPCMQFEIVKTIWNTSPSTCFRLVENIHIHLDCSFRDTGCDTFVGRNGWMFSVGLFFGVF